jgi:hypothetical protein
VSIRVLEGKLSMEERVILWMNRRHWLLSLGGALAAAGLALGQKEDQTPRVWIYRDVPNTGQKDTRSESERYFAPFFFFPESKARDLSVNINHPASDFDRDEKGTCVEFVFRLAGANDWAGIGFVPGGDVRNKPPLNIAKELLIGFGRPVHLRFRARTKPGQTVRVRFESGGLTVGKTGDGIRFPQVPEPEVTVLKDQWRDITIDLTKKAAGLERVVCPLKVIVRGSENVGKEEITVYVDDICFEVGVREKEKK